MIMTKLIATELDFLKIAVCHIRRRSLKPVCTGTMARCPPRAQAVSAHRGRAAAVQSPGHHPGLPFLTVKPALHSGHQ